MRLLTFLLICLLGCKSPSSSLRVADSENSQKRISKLVLSSTAFSEGANIPVKYTCDGEDVSPPLKWSGIPEGTKSLVLICDDPDAPMGTWVHWVVYDIPPMLTELAEGVKIQTIEGAKQGVNDFNKSDYGGPCPPEGDPHRYYFKLYALDTQLNLQPGLRKDAIVKAMQGHILAEGQLTGKYRRK
ncbi:MAG: YbhB/YbcL family Raf kinase inhibitor-like protein [Acidobacteriota bacterium]|nr:YbhB/YbcL family Raf kinase inhibitor-like protein [Blastocatellia bacterium]MDW8411482.1 YbhB/YbcL family Raf kinase inhibitor-like protein [Acidobacteriota bacterium]